MSERDGYKPGVPCWVDTWQPDAGRRNSTRSCSVGVRSGGRKSLLMRVNQLEFA
jgi:hypothetical protein